MYKCNSESAARAMAVSESLFYGTSVFDGKVYVGHPDELAKIGVTDIRDCDGVAFNPNKTVEVQS